MKKQVLITVVVAILAFVIGYRADKTYDLKRESVKSDNTSVSSATSSERKYGPSKPGSSSQPSSSSSSKSESKPIQQRADATFRNAKWGDSHETVKKYEKEELKYDTDDSMGTFVTMYGDEYTLAYMFENDKLYMGGYRLNENLSGGQYISEFNTLKEKLKEVYGEPIEDERYEYGRVYEDDLGLSLTSGKIAYHTEWRTANTIIELQLGAKDYDEALVIRYTDINYKDNPKDSGL